MKHRIISLQNVFFKNTVINILSKRYDEMSKQICKQIAVVTNLVAVQAKYHQDCYVLTVISMF